MSREKAETLENLSLKIQEFEASLSFMRNELADLAGQLAAMDVFMAQRLEKVTDRQPSSFSIDARDFILNRDEFYKIEYTQSGEAFRWTGPRDTIELYVSIDRSRKIVLTMHVISIGGNSSIEDIVLRVDDTIYPFREAQHEPMVVMSDPIDAIHDGRPAAMTKIQIKTKNMLIPGDTDDRVLGIAISRITADVA